MEDGWQAMAMLGMIRRAVLALLLHRGSVAERRANSAGGGGGRGGGSRLQGAAVLVIRGAGDVLAVCGLDPLPRDGRCYTTNNNTTNALRGCCLYPQRLLRC